MIEASREIVERAIARGATEDYSDEDYHARYQELTGMQWAEESEGDGDE